MSPKTTVLTKFLSFWQVFLCFLVYSFKLHQVTAKKPLENATSEFYGALYAENWAKIRENPYFSQKSRYLKNTIFLSTFARKVLES